jgi:DNA-binding transcriptional regulator YiaG
MTFSSEEPAEIFKRDTMGRVRVSRARREALLDEYERSGISGVQFANYVGIKYSTLANWIQKRQRRGRFNQSLVKGSEGVKESTKANSSWVEAVIEKSSGQGAQEGALRIYFAAGAYCQIGNAREAGLAAELIGRLGTRGC